jgi:maltose alpha-D-glucosyltransferase/alpha-amylase
MQWTPDRNAGFSTADPGKVYLPAVQSLNYHYAAVNVESQMATSSSLLNWTRSMLQVRREHPAFGMGGYRAVEADNAAVLAFLRILEPDEEKERPGETILCVNNLSRTAQGTRLRLSGYAGAKIADIFGGTGFDSVPEDGMLPLTLGSRDFFWLRLTGGHTAPPNGPGDEEMAAESDGRRSGDRMADRPMISTQSGGQSTEIASGEGAAG